MKTVAQYRADLFVIAPEFKTTDPGKLADIDTLIGMAMADYDQNHPKYDRIVVYKVASQLRIARLAEANTTGYSSVRAGNESVTMHSGSSIEGNPYLMELNSLLGTDGSAGRVKFAQWMGTRP